MARTITRTSCDYLQIDRKYRPEAPIFLGKSTGVQLSSAVIALVKLVVIASPLVSQVAWAQWNCTSGPCWTMGNVGIGTTSPLVEGLANSPTILNVQPSANYGTAVLKLGSNTPALGNGLIEVGAAGYLSGDHWAGFQRLG